MERTEFVVILKALLISNAHRNSLLGGEVLVVPNEEVLVPVQQLSALNAPSGEDNIWNGAVPLSNVLTKRLDPHLKCTAGNGN